MNDFSELDSAIDGCLHQFEKVGLGREREVYPSYPTPHVEEDRTIYPSLWLNNMPKAPKLGDSGKATIEYRVESRSSNTQKGKPERHSADLKIISIDPIGVKKPKKSKVKSFESLGADLDDVLEFADRKRDGAGQYAAGQSGAGVADFRAAHVTSKRKKLKRGAVIGGALAGAGALVGGTGMGRRAASRLGQGVLRAANSRV